MKKPPLAITISVLSLCFSSGSGAVAQKPSKKPVPVSVTSSIEGNGTLPDPTIYNYRIQGDLLGPYQDGVDSVESFFDTGGDWQLNALTSPVRSMLLDFRGPVPNSNPSPPFSVGQLPARIITKSYLLYGSGNRVSDMKGLNSTLVTPLLVRFDLNGNTYRLWMNSLNYPETNYAVVSCTAVVDSNNPDTSQCNEWKIEPSVTQPDGQKKNNAKLVRFYTSRGKTIEEDHGNFYMSFSIVVTNP